MATLISELGTAALHKISAKTSFFTRNRHSEALAGNTLFLRHHFIAAGCGRPNAHSAKRD